MAVQSRKMRLLSMDTLEGWVFHKLQHGIEFMFQILTRTLTEEARPRVRIPFMRWFTYAVATAGVWAVWPAGKELPAEVWIGVLSFEGLLAALLASVGPAATYQGVVPSILAFWSALDANMGRTLKEQIRIWREDPTHSTSPSPIKNAFVIALYSLFWLPMIVVLDSRWAAAILTASLLWTARRIVSDAVAFFAPDYATVLPRMYWTARSRHESMSECPICKGKPQQVAWPPPREGQDTKVPPETGHPATE